MSQIKIAYRSSGSCQVVHASTNAAITTDNPPEYGGGGTSFSATDLVAAGLGVCIATTLDPIIERHGIDLSEFSLTVDKTLSRQPKGIEQLVVTISSNVAIPEELMLKLKRAVNHCGVKRSLHPDVKVEIVFAIPS